MRTRLERDRTINLQCNNNNAVRQTINTKTTKIKRLFMYICYTRFYGSRCTTALATTGLKFVRGQKMIGCGASGLFVVHSLLANQRTSPLLNAWKSQLLVHPLVTTKPEISILIQRCARTGL